MIDAIVSGKLIKDCPLKISQYNKPYCQVLLSVPVEGDNTVFSGIAFGENADRIAKFSKGDALSVCGSLKPTEWEDKATGETQHGLSITVSGVLTAYDVQKRRKKNDTSGQQNSVPYYNDEIPL